MTSALLGYFNQRPEIGGAATTFNANVPQIYVDVDRARAEALGLSVSDIYAAIGANFGSRYVNDFTLNGRVFQVNLQADADFRAHSEDILKLHVRSRNGTMVPLRSVVSLTTVLAPFVITRYNLSVSAQVNAVPAPAPVVVRPWRRWSRLLRKPSRMVMAMSGRACLSRKAEAAVRR